MTKKQKAGSEIGVRDLSDFCVKWPELRKLIRSKDVQTSHWSSENKEILVWLMILADKVCTMSEKFPVQQAKDPLLKRLD